MVVLAVGTVGNTLVLALFAKYKSLRTTSNVLVINLTVADLLMCVLCLPMLTINYIRGEFDPHLEEYLCYYDAFMGAFTGFMSIWSLTALAVDRCIVIARSLPVYFSNGNRIAYCTIAGIWLVSGVGAGLPFLGLGQYVMDGSNISCTFDFFTQTETNMIYNIILQVFYFCIPVACIIGSYLTIYILVRNHEKRYFSARETGNYDEISLRRMCRCRKLEKNELKTARTAVILISVFCISWTPYSIVSWIALLGDRSGLTPLAVTLPGLFAKLSTVLNPIVYALLHRNFKAKMSIFLKQQLRGAILRGFSENTNSRVILYETNKPLLTLLQRESKPSAV